MNSNVLQIGRNLQRIMNEKKITAKELAVKVGVSPTHISYIINDKRRASFDLVEQIAIVLGVDTHELFMPEKTNIDDLTKTEKDFIILARHAETLFLVPLTFILSY